MSTGKSLFSIHNAAVQAVSLAVFAAFGDNPIFLALNTGGILADAVDPYGYDTTVTRQFVNTTAQEVFDKLFQLRSGSDAARAAAAKAVQASAQSLTEEQKEEAIAAALSYWQEFNNVPKDYTFCFQDYVNPNVDQSLSGAPTSRCDQVYTNAYNEYVVNNKAIYEERQIEEGQHLIDQFNNAQLNLNKVTVENERDTYVAVLSIVFAIIGFLALGIVVWWAVARRRG